MLVFLWIVIVIDVPDPRGMFLLGPGKSQVTKVGIIPNKHSQLARYCLVWGIRPVYGLATVGQVTIKVFYRLRPCPPCMFLVFFNVLGMMCKCLTKCR